MYCARLDHFGRFNASGTIGKCGHMISPPGFNSWQEMQNSQWLLDLKQKMEDDQWPAECGRCQTTEQISGHSIRLDSLARHQLLSKIDPDYIILGGALDNVCNSACQSCNASLSTKIGSLSGRNYIMIDNSPLFDRIPLDRVVELDLSGGEPTASPRYQALVANLPPSVRVLRVNTNGSRVLPNLQAILDRGVHVIITLSFDGTGKVHDYVRWPIKWDKYVETVNSYNVLCDRYRNLTVQAWTVLHTLNAMDYNNMMDFVESKRLKHSWAFLEKPTALDPRGINHLTIAAKKSLESTYPDIAKVIASGHNNQQELDKFLQEQDQLRNISFTDYL